MLINIEKVSYIIKPKSQFGILELKVIGFVYNIDSCRLESSKVIKILE